MKYLIELWSRNTYFRPFVIISTLLIFFGSIFLPLNALTYNGSFVISSAFPIIAGWLLGLRLGLLFWGLYAVLLMFLAQAAGSGINDLLTSGIPSYIFTFFMTCGTGRISDLTKSLRHELQERKKVELELQRYKETLEIQVKERTEDLMRINDQLNRQIVQNEKANREKLNLQTSLKRAEKMEAVGILAGSVAHDLNNILTGILSYPELIMLEIPEDSPLKEPLLTIQNSGKRAAAVVQDLLTLVRKEILNPEVTNLNRIVSDFLHSPECKKMHSDYPGTTIVTTLSPDLLCLHGSPVHLSKIVMNLILNSMEAMTKGGELTITTANVTLDKPTGQYEIIPEGSYVAVEISDTGDGISKNDLDRIFEPFYTKKVMGRSGTGLGLAIVWGTLKDHGGYVDVRSQEGEGTIFTLYFPATDQEMLSEIPHPKTHHFAGNGESILVIDDEKLQRDLCTSYLKKLGYAVQAVSSGETAIEYLQNSAVDLLILDMIMPGGMDGFETYKRSIEIHPGQKAIIVSGFTESEHVKNAQALGAGAYLKKPYTLEKLGMAVQHELTSASAHAGGRLDEITFDTEF
jgi:signal transduction histidine kinase/ActR/RegA family two-component response regulator